MAIMISPSRAMEISEFSQALSRGALRCDIGGAVTGTGVTGSRGTLGGVVMPSIHLP